MVRITYAAAAMAALAMADTSVTQVPVKRKAVSFAQKVLKTYQKYAVIGAQAPAYVVDAAKSPINSSSPAISKDDDELYVVPVQVGGQTLYLDFDTGSSDLWVFSTLTPANQSVNHTLYDPSISGKLVPNATWNIGYGDGSGASGIVYKDSVAVGSAVVKQQIVEAATEVSEEFTEDTTNSGLLGLAFRKLNTVVPGPQETWFNNVKFSLSQRLFTADLKHEAAGTYDFGYIDSSKYTGNITYSWIDQTQGFWNFTAGALSVKGHTSDPLGYVIADTGTTLMYLPDNAVETYWNTTQTAFLDYFAGGIIFNCSETLPDLQISVKNVQYTVPGEYINAGSLDDTNTYCFGGLQSADDLGISILGDVFLKSVFVVFNEVYNPRIGLAPKVLSS